MPTMGNLDHIEN